MTIWASDAAFLEFRKNALDFFTLAVSVLPPVRLAAYDVAYRQYKKVRMPYGDNHAGLVQWVRDLAEMERMRIEMGRVKRRHESLMERRVTANKDIKALRAYLEEIQ